jgi:hypothetical protein
MRCEERFTYNPKKEQPVQRESARTIARLRIDKLGGTACKEHWRHLEMVASSDLDETMLWFRLASAHVPMCRIGSSVDKRGQPRPQEARRRMLDGQKEKLICGVPLCECD